MELSQFRSRKVLESESSSILPNETGRRRGHLPTSTYLLIINRSDWKMFDNGGRRRGCGFTAVRMPAPVKIWLGGPWTSRWS